MELCLNSILRPNKFEIFLLYETHVIDEKQSLFEVYFKNYTIHWIPASKTHKSGRASGGCLYGFKKDVQKHFMFKFKNIFNNIVLTAI